MRSGTEDGSYEIQTGRIEKSYFVVKKNPKNTQTNGKPTTLTGRPRA